MRRTGLLLTLAVAAACDDSPSPIGPAATQAGLDVQVALSSLSAVAGQRVAVAVRTTGAQQIGAVQGTLRFDATRLRYIGQVPEGKTLVMVNDGRAGKGELRVASMNVAGLAPMTGTLVFEVLSGGYTAGLAYDFETAAFTDVMGLVREISKVRTRRDVALDASLRVAPDARRMALADWLATLDEDDRGILARPGQYLLNLRYGDANLNGSVLINDAFTVANVAVGNIEIIVGSDAPSIDVVVAGNVFPANAPGLGEVGDANPPGRESNGSRVINITDAFTVANEAVGNNQPVAGELVPGRGPLATNRVLVPAGEITASATWTRDNIYELQGLVRVGGGATLTIEAGTRIEGSSTANPSALIILRDGRIIADGTALQPILFTCTAATKTKGCWGGLFVAGNASVNEGTPSLGPSPVVPGRDPVGGANQRQAEGTTGLVTYGGANDADNSGVLRYLVIEYAGFLLAPNNELNGLTLAGVGNGTIVENIQAHAGLDDGIELFGGTVNLKHLYLTANSDDSFDVSFGWNGSAQFVLIQHDPNDSDKGIEADNTENSLTFGNTPRTSPLIYNLTFVGPPDPTVGAGTNASNDAFHLRRGTGPTIRNAIVLNARIGVDIDDAATCAAINAAGGLNFTNSIVANNPAIGNADGDQNPCGPYASATGLEAAWITDAANSNQVLPGPQPNLLQAPTDFVLPDFRPRFGQAGAGATPPNNGFFDVSATYIGAVQPANSTRSNIPWYSGWTRGWANGTTP